MRLVWFMNCITGIMTIASSEVKITAATSTDAFLGCLPKGFMCRRLPT